MSRSILSQLLWYVNKLIVDTTICLLRSLRHNKLYVRLILGVMKLFAERLRTLRRQHDLTQKELGDRVGLSPSAIGMYEAGKSQPDLETVKRLAEILHTTTDYLIGHDAPDGAKRSGLGDILREKTNLDDRDIAEVETIIQVKESRAQYDDDDDPPPLKPSTVLAFHRTDDPLSELPEEARRAVLKLIEELKQTYPAKKGGDT